MGKHTKESILKHIGDVYDSITKITVALEKRASNHDQSKLTSPEIEGFTALDSMGSTSFGSVDYAKNLEKQEAAIEHHYKTNRHHPEHFDTGVNEMNLIDVVEMFCDWYSQAVKNGKIEKSFKICKHRFDIGDDLYQVLLNTVKVLEEEK